MKRRITVEQLNELTPEQKQKLRELWKPQADDKVMDFRGKESHISMLSTHFYKEVYGNEGLKKFQETMLPLLSIGQMIELLESKDQCLNIVKRTDLEGWGYEIQLRQSGYCKFTTSELVDGLWEAVVKFL